MVSPDNSRRRPVSAQLRRNLQRARRYVAHSRAWVRCSCSAAGDYAMRLWLDPSKAGGAQHDRPADVDRRGARAECAGGGRRGGRAARRPTASDFQLAVNARKGRLVTEEALRQHHRSGAIRLNRRPGAHPRCRTRVEMSARHSYRAAQLAQQQGSGRPSRIFQAPGSNALQLSNDVRATMQEAEGRVFPQGVELHHRLRSRPALSQTSIDQGRAHPDRGGAAGGAGGDRVPANLARFRDSPAGGAGVDHRHFRRACCCWAIPSTRLTLFGLVLAIGIVVDDAIVVVENVERNIERRPDVRTRRPSRPCSEVSRSHYCNRAGAVRRIHPARPSCQACRASSTNSSPPPSPSATVISAFNSLTLSPAMSRGAAASARRPQARLP